MRVSVVIPSETIKKQNKKGQREEGSSLFRSRGSPNQIAYGTAVREGMRTPKKEGKEHTHAKFIMNMRVKIFWILVIISHTNLLIDINDFHASYCVFFWLVIISIFNAIQ